MYDMKVIGMSILLTAENNYKSIQIIKKVLKQL